MSKQELKDEHKQTEGSPELKAALRRRQHETARNSARRALAEATVVLTNPTHFAVALRYRPGEDAAPIVVARGRGATAEAIRELAGEHEVPLLSYPQLARALYYTSRTGQMIREDLYMAVATDPRLRLQPRRRDRRRHRPARRRRADRASLRHARPPAGLTVIRSFRHSRESGNPASSWAGKLDLRFRGADV